MRPAVTALVASVAVVVQACAGGGDDAVTATSGPAGTTTASSVTTSAVAGGAATTPQGFDRTSIAITRADGSVLAWCVWLAGTEAERQRGLMDVTDLGGPDGMLFRFDGSTEDRFYMLRTRVALSIAFFDEGGQLVSAADMAPCPDDDDDPACPRYTAGTPYVDALEVPTGALAAAGIGAGARLEVQDRSC